MNPAPVVQKIQQLNSVDARGQSVATYNVTFMVGEHGPFTIPVAAADFTAAKVQEQLQKFAQEVNALAPSHV